MQEKVEIITNHFEHYWTKIPKNGYCGLSKFDRSVVVNLNPIYKIFFGVYATCFLLEKSLEFVKISSDG